jgi:hypothetical protein
MSDSPVDDKDKAVTAKRGFFDSYGVLMFLLIAGLIGIVIYLISLNRVESAYN